MVTTDAEPLIDLRDVTRTYASPSGAFSALAGVSLTINRGEFLAVAGRSGSGKSTLLGMMAGLDRPTTGTVRIGGTAVHTLPERALSRWRGRNVGVVFQFFQLLPTLTALENVCLPMDFCGTWPARERRGRGLALLERLGVGAQAHKLPNALSGGEQQRVAVARALSNEPQVLLADEPTGNLDSHTAAGVLETFADLVRGGQTIVMVTHEAAALTHASRSVTLVDGRLDG